MLACYAMHVMLTQVAFRFLPLSSLFMAEAAATPPVSRKGGVGVAWVGVCESVAQKCELTLKRACAGQYRQRLQPLHL